MGPPKSTLEIKRFEISEVYAHPEATVDIVLVHGLSGDPQRTWTAKNGTFWPTDLLPITLKTVKVRILVYGYNADVWAFGNDRSTSSDMIHQHAQTLITTLALERSVEGYDEHPILWVAHSLGGILVKRALELSNDLSSRSSDLSRSIFVSTYGIIFLGTPHNGADPAKWGAMLQKMADILIPKKAMDTDNILVRTLKANNETLQNINLHFLDIFGRFEIDMVHEAMKTDFKVSQSYIVDRDSASPQLPGVNYYGIEATHSGMCKFESKNSPGYTNVSQKLLIWARDCSPLIDSRWIAERRARQQVKENEAKEMLGMFGTVENMVGPSAKSNSAVSTPALSNSGILTTSIIHSVASIEPEKVRDVPFIKPQGFRPNSQFVGRETELGDMHRMLFDKKRRAEGTSAVLLQCIPGGGKTHLARQYVYKYFNNFRGGIFWVSAKSEEQLADGFWDIARKVAFKPLSDSDKEAGLVRKNPEEFITIVREWFENSQDWLLILDGIQFEHAEALTRYIPDSKNSSLIYTSTERNAGGDHHFMNPQVIRLPPLSPREAQDLFILELDKKNPTTTDLQNAMELVQRMDFLPLVIHAAAQQLKATDEPLAKFARHYPTAPKLRGLETFRAVVEQLKSANATEALNLMNTICFFSQHIPVEMIILGSTALDVYVKTSEFANGSSINNTFKILNRFALIDRSEDPLVSSQTSKGSRGWLSEDIDVIRLHSVVQDYFVDVMRADGNLPTWLDRAVKLFCRSFDYANMRIKSKTNTGLVGDYRYYKIHGRRLQEHLVRSEKRFHTLKENRERIDNYLIDIKNEIDRRTRESSQDLVHGRSGIFEVSIFDRNSSSSDTGPETSETDRNSHHSSTWTSDRVRHDSPLNIADHFEFPPEVGDAQFPLPTFEDRGYDSDCDTVSNTVRPLHASQSPRIDDEGWQSLREPRNRTELPPRLDLISHRTIKAQEKSRYHDTAGSWRAVNPAASDPRVTNETASAFIPQISYSTSPPSHPSILSHIRPVSRGRLPTVSGMSVAEVELGRINKISPPPGRGGGMIQDRRRSKPRRPTSITDSEGRLLVGMGPYANVSVQADIGHATSPTAERSRRGSSPITPAQMSLQHLPHDGQLSSLPQHMLEETSPRLGYRQLYPNSDTVLFDLPGRWNQENATDSGSVHCSQPLNHVYMPPYLPTYPSSRSTMAPLPYPSSLHANAASFSRNNSIGVATGYTSQPMSRGPSAESAGHISISSEPLPQLPVFSPRVGVAPTSYQVYEESHRSASRRWSQILNRAQERVQSLSRSQSRDTERPDKSTQLNYSYGDVTGMQNGTGFASEFNWKENRRLDSDLPRTQSPFNPKAPLFVPRSRLSPSNTAHHLTSQISHSNGAPIEIPTGTLARSSVSTQFMHPATPTLSPGGLAPWGSFSGSGGFKVDDGRRLIGFGDFPEVVDVEERRRERERGNLEKERESYRRWREETDSLRRRGRGMSGLGEEEDEEGLGLGIGI